MRRARNINWAGSHMGFRTVVGVALWAFAFDASALDSPAAPDVGEDLTQLSLEELANVQVTSVSKKPESLAQAPAAIYVITHDEIMRSGVTTLSEALRLAPNLSLTRLGATNYTGTARGFGGNQADQAFPNQTVNPHRWAQRLHASVLGHLSGCAGCSVRGCGPD